MLYVDEKTDINRARINRAITNKELYTKNSDLHCPPAPA